MVVAEVLRGRAEFALKGEPDRLVNAYHYLALTIESLGRFRIEPFSVAAAQHMEELKRKHQSRKRYADLQLAAITLAGGHCLVTRNLKHFKDLVPASQLENWMED